MPTPRQISHTQRGNFKKIMSQLDKTKSEKRIVAIVTQATEFLTKQDVGWDTVSLHIPSSYVLLSERRKRPAANGHAPGVGVLGRDRRDLLKRAIVQHPDWEVVRTTLSLDLSNMVKADLLATAQLLNIEPKFLALFNEPEVASPETPPVTPPSNQETS